MMKKITINNEQKLKKQEKFNVAFAKDLSEKITLTKNNHQLNMSFKGKKSRLMNRLSAKGQIEKDKVTYKDFEDGIDLKYELKGNKVKESIIINKLQDTYEFVFDLEIGGLTPVLNDKNNTLELKDNGKVVYKVLSPFMEDALKNRSDDCYYEIEHNNDNLKIILKCDANWINSKERKLPIVIDPTIELVNEDVLVIKQIKNDQEIDAEKEYYLGTLYDSTKYSLLINLDINAIKSNSQFEKSVYLSLKTESIPRDGTLYAKKLDGSVISSQKIENNKKEIIFDLMPVIKESINSFNLILENSVQTIYSFDNEEKYKPCLVFSGIQSTNNFRSSNYKNYQLDERNTLKVNLMTQKYYLHEHYDASISDNILSVDLKHIYDSQETKNYYLGNKVRTNFHQFLVKGKEFNKLLGCKNVTFIDSQGIKHELYEKWYYLDNNKKKHYIEKEKIYMDSDQKLKFNDENNNIYEVFYECLNDEGLQYISANSLMNYCKVEKAVVKGDLYLPINGSEIKLKKTGVGYAEVPYFFKEISSSLTMNFVDHQEVYLSKDGTKYVDKNGEAYSCYKCNSRLIYNGSNFKIKKIISVTLPKRPPNDTIYVNESEELITLTVRPNIFSNKDSIVDVYINDDLNQIINQIEAIDEKLNEINNNYHTLSQNNEIIQKRIDFLNSQIEKYEGTTQNEETKASIEFNKIQIEELNFSIESNNKQINSLAENNSSCSLQKEMLLKKKNTLVDEQLNKVNDLIVDKNEIVYGFDGYGRLILIQDKYEHKININYGKDEDNDDKIIDITTSSQIIKFNYDSETGLLMSLLDSQGRLTRYDYEENGDLIAFIYNDNKLTLISEYNGYEIISQNLKRLKLYSLNDRCANVEEYVYDGKIDKKMTENNEDVVMTKLVLKDQYLSGNFPSTSPTDIIDINKKTQNYYFDEQFRLVKFIHDDNVEVCTYLFNNVLNKVSYKKENCIHEFGECLPNNTYLYEKKSFSDKPIGIQLPIFSNVKVSVIVDAVVTFSNGSAERKQQAFYDVYHQEVIMPLFNKDKYFSSVEFKMTVLKGEIKETELYANLITLDEAKTYEYDEFKRLVKEQSKTKEIKYYYHSDDNKPYLITETNNRNEIVETRYTYNDKNYLTYVEDSKQNAIEYYYDKFGNCIEKRAYNKKDASLMKVERANYDENGNLIDSFGKIKDKNGNYPKQEIKYLPNTNIKNQIKGLNNETLTYNYDFNNGNLLSISSSSYGVNNSTRFKYNYGLLLSMLHHGLNVDYEYDGLGRRTRILFNREEFVRYQYSKFDESFTDQIEANTTALKTIYYDGTSIKTTFDEKDKLIEEEVKYKNSSSKQKVLKSQYTYDSYGDIENKYVFLNDKQLERYEYTYHSDYIHNGQRVICDFYKYDADDNEILDHYYDYDSDNDKILSESYSIDGSSYETRYTYGSNNVIQASIYNKDNKLIYKNNYTYDILDRIKHNTIALNAVSVCYEYSYLQQDENTLDLISECVTKVEINNNDSKTYLMDTTSYSYDVNGNIIEIYNDDNKITYHYDSLNRVIREDNSILNETKTYKYDKAGNILNIKTYAYNKPSNEDLNSFKKIDEFTYACDGWKDQLIDFNGKQIAYDSMGRPTTYKNMEFKWNTLNQLEEIPELHVIYEYDSLGIRNKKVIDGFETKIITEGTKILKVINDKKYEIIFTYSLNKLIGFIYTKDGISKEYIYIRNIQGDIKSICDNKGRIVASYEYNAYGNCIITENIDDIANINPFRYRGYYYDEETGLYYLNSRYYDPETGRFISPDTLSILDETKGQINGLNLYMYCGDNPIMNIDPSGYFATLFLTVVFGALVTYMSSGATRAWHTSTSLGITGWERAYYTVAGLFVGDYLVVKDNWDIVSQTINMDEKNYNFEFQKNPYYSFWTAGLFANFLEENYYTNEYSRTTLGLYLELQLHYILYLFGNEHGTDGASMGPISEDSNAIFFEFIAILLRRKKPSMGPTFSWEKFISSLLGPITKAPFLFI